MAMYLGIIHDLDKDPITGNIFQRVVSGGTISVGELLVSPLVDTVQVNHALGTLVSHGVVNHTGNYYSLSALGAQVARYWSHPSIPDTSG